MKLADKSALLIIDQQQGIDHPKLGQRNNPDAEATMLKLLELWRATSRPIIHVKHRSTEPGSVFWPEQDGFEFKADFLPRDGELVVEKSIPCALLKSGLGALLKRQNICTLVLVGASTNNSVESTARTASGLGYNVYVIEDACFTFAKDDYFGNPKTAQEVHAMSLANLQGEYAQILTSGQILDIS